jgi:hypothetical protein
LRAAALSKQRSIIFGRKMKLHVSIKALAHFLAVALITGGFIMAAKFPGLETIFQTFSYSILVATGLYHANDFGSNWLSTPAIPSQPPLQAPNLTYNATQTVTDTQTSTASQTLPPPQI